MTDSDAARRDILRAIRENLKPRGIAPRSAEPVQSTADPGPAARGSPPGLRPGSVGPVERASPDAVTRFKAQLAAVGAQCTLACGEPDAARVLARILTDAGARRVVGSDAPLVQRLLSTLGHDFVRESLDRLSRDALFACDAGVTTAQWGIAETGTLVLESARERSRLLSLVPPIHVALLSTRCICESLGNALDRVRQAASHAITFITGPSRTSDIELTLVVGVHGPQTVHVLLLEDV